MTPFRFEAAGCFKPGPVDFTLEVDGYAGGVSRITIEEGEPTAHCLERVFADVCFEPFHAQVFEIRFPYKLRGMGAPPPNEWVEVAPGAPTSCASAPPSKRSRTSPGREEIVVAMRSIKDAVAACFEESGEAQIRYRVQGTTGRVTQLHVDGPAATPGCVERSFAALCFEPFRKEVFQVSFPFKVGRR